MFPLLSRCPISTGLVVDVNGQEIAKGDVVAPLNGDFRGRVSDVKNEDGEGFVCIRPAHRPYSKGIWYASEHVQWLSKARVPKTEEEKKKDEEAKKKSQAQRADKAKKESEAKAKKEAASKAKKSKKAKTAKSKKSSKSK